MKPSDKAVLGIHKKRQGTERIRRYLQDSVVIGTRRQSTIIAPTYFPVVHLGIDNGSEHNPEYVEDVTLCGRCKKL